VNIPHWLSWGEGPEHKITAKNEYEGNIKLIVELSRFTKEKEGK
jgi:hypothetical protein